MAAPTRTPSHKDSTNTAAWDANIPDFKGYNGSPNLKRAGVVCNYTQEMKDEFIRCRDDVMYFCEKYIKIVHVDHGLIPIRLYDYQKEIIESSQQHRKTIVLTSRQAGKALALDTKIPLPDGTFTTMGKLKVGDMVIGSSGIPVRVTFTSEIHHKPTYKMYFDDGSTVVACEDHQWVVDDSITGNSMRLSTKEIALGSAFSDSTRFSIRNASAILYSKPTKPVSSFDDSPNEWLTAPVVDRFCLVHEMTKTPTTVKVGSSFTVYPIHVDKFARIVNSLGYTAIIDGDSLSFDIRKTHRTIVDIHPVDIVPTRCITVDADDHLFLFGESFIPTHNTTVATCVILHYILFNKHKTVAILANKGDAALEIMSRIQLAYEYLPRWLQSGIVEWNKGSIELENGSKVIASATSGSAIRGKSCVRGDTIVRLRDKQTGVVIEPLIEDISNPQRYQIFDGETFRDFLEIRVQEKELFRIETASGLYVDATGDHRILTESGEWVTVDDIDHTTFLMHGGRVLSKESIGVDSVYDPVDVEESSRYWGNGLIHHNCSLVYIDECVGADTKITLLDYTTGAQFDTTIGGLFIEMGQHVEIDGIATIVANTRYSVLSETGFVNFSSIKKTAGKSIKIHFSDGSHLECAYSHKIKMLSGNFSEAHEILVGDNTSTGLCVTAIEHGSQDVDLYDLLDVAAGNEYLTGSVTSHNCAFVEGWDDFYTSVYPTISSGKTTKMLFTSCVPKGTLVLSDDGIHDIADFIDDSQSGFYNVNDYKVYGHGKSRQGNLFYNNGLAKTRKITTKSGVVEASHPHKFFGCTIEGEYKWIETGDLRIGDYLIEVGGQQCFGASVMQADVDQSLSDVPRSVLVACKESQIEFLKQIHHAFVVDAGCSVLALPNNQVALKIKMMLLNLGIFSELSESTLSISHPTSKSVYLNLIVDDTVEIVDEPDEITESAKFLYENLHGQNIRFVPVKKIEESENEVYDFSLPHDEADFFCHSVLYNGILGHQTPNGLNHYYKYWTDAVKSINGFNPIEVKWNRIPGRDDAWQHDTLAGMNFDYEKFAQEFDCEFMGSSGTLIAGSALKSLSPHIPIYEWEGFAQYVAPVKNRSYAIVCDVSRGKGLDYSAFSVIDVTCMPYDQVATYRANTITPTDYAGMINKIGILYNMASVLVENNDMGGQVASLLFEDHDYDNLLFSMSNGKAGKVLCGGGSNAELGIRTTTAVKSKGCAVLKLLIEQQQLIIRDFNTIGELSRFTKKGKSYEAESGHDDLVMGLVLFSWMTVNPYFSNLTDVVTMHGLGESTMDDCLPFGFIDDGVEAYHEAETGEIQNAGWSLGY